jgi:hypothetical protein
MKESVDKDLEKLRALNRARLTGTAPRGTTTATILMCQTHSKIVEEARNWRQLRIGHLRTAPADYERQGEIGHSAPQE